MSVARKVLGLIILLVGLVGLGAGLYGMFWLQGAADRTERTLVEGLDFGIESLELISDTLKIARQTVDDTTGVLNAAVEGTEETATTLDAARPALIEFQTMVAEDLPESINSIQATMPALEQATAAIDTTLRTLARFQWSTTVPLIDYEMSFGLGIEYDPPVPLDASVREVSGALESIPGQLASIRSSLSETDSNLEQTISSIDKVGDSLSAVSQDLEDTSSVLEEYSTLVERMLKQVRGSRRGIRGQVQTIRMLLSGFLIWLALAQLAPLYLGCTLFFSQKATSSNDYPKETPIDPQEEEQLSTEG